MDISKSYELPFSADTVYQAWISNDTVIPPATAMQITPTVGGDFILHAEGPGFKATMHGTFLEIVPPTKLRYTWAWTHEDERTEVAVTFASTAQGCSVALEHTGFTNPESHAIHDQGWDSYIAGLTAHLQGHASGS